MPPWLLPGPFPPEFETDERCAIVERLNDPACPDVSLARAHVAPGVTTRRHRLTGITERYVIVAGTGLVEIGGESAPVGPGDRVLIAPGLAQRIRTTPAPAIWSSIASAPRVSCRRPMSTWATDHRHALQSGEAHACLPPRNCLFLLGEITR